MLQVSLARLKQGHRTVGYPAKDPVLPDRFRGLPVIDTAKCEDGCRLCADACPTDAIEIGEDGARIDLGKCVFCGYCVEACPEDAIRMDTGILEFSSYSRLGMIYTKEMLLSLEPIGADGRPTSPVPIPANRTV